MDLNEARDIINRADEQIVAALKERMRAVTEVARYKQAHNLPVLDEKREEKVLERVAAMAGDDMSGMARELYRHIMALSRDYQTKMLGRDGKIRLLVLNGPNLNMLGIREPNIYGKKTYADLTAYIRAEAEKLGADVEIFQSNHEGALVEKIQSALHHFDGIVSAVKQAVSHAAHIGGRSGQFQQLRAGFLFIGFRNDVEKLQCHVYLRIDINGSDKL